MTIFYLGQPRQTRVVGCFFFRFSVKQMRLEMTEFLQRVY